MALGVRRGKIKREDAHKSVLGIADSKMTDQQLMDYANTPDSALESKSLLENEEIMKDYIKILCDTNEIDITGINLDQLTDGFRVELEHGSKGGNQTNITGDDAVTTIKIALAHLKEIPDYYTRLDKLEANAGVKEDVFVNGSNINGMGSATLPGNMLDSMKLSGQQDVGSGDIPYILDPSGRKKRYKFFITYDEFEP
jgi:hypothetical protein